MSTPRTLVAIVACTTMSLVAAACTSERHGVGTIFGVDPTASSTTLTTQLVETSTTESAPTTITPPPTLPETTTSTVVPTTLAPTTTTEPPTTTTLPPGASLPLRFDGVGDARFGADPEDVLTYLTSVLGPPTADTGWVASIGLACDGTEARTIFYNDLKLTFGDQSNVSSGRRHFFAWQFGPPYRFAPNPAGMATQLGVTIGTSVADIQKAYPAVQLTARNATTDASAQLSEGLVVVLTDITPTGAVTLLRGGQGCGP